MPVIFNLFWLMHGGWWRWTLLSPDGVAPSQMSASVNLPLHHKVQKFSSGTGSPGWSRKKGRKTVVCVCVCLTNAPSQNPFSMQHTAAIQSICSLQSFIKWLSFKNTVKTTTFIFLLSLVNYQYIFVCNCVNWQWNLMEWYSCHFFYFQHLVATPSFSAHGTLGATHGV